MDIPFFASLRDARRVLLAGAGGGFDIVSGMPLYFHLRSLGCEVVLANYSFTDLAASGGEEICAGTFEITPASRDLPYFPEKGIVDWLAARGESPTMIAFSNRLGVAPLREAYAQLVAQHEIDTILLVDGGTDSLIFGDEPHLGTIVEDACSMVAAVGSPAARRYLVATGFGVDHFHGVSHHACLENIATLIRDGSYLGAFSLTQDMPEGAAYLDLVRTLNARMPRFASIVANSIASALRGEFGDSHNTDRTSGTELFINPLMGLYWAFTLDGVVARMQFVPRIETTQTLDEVARAIRLHFATATRRPRRPIPL